MKRFFLIVLCLAICLLTLLPAPVAQAVGKCTLVTNPPKVTTDLSFIDLTISSPGLEEGKEYNVKIVNNVTVQKVSGGKIVITHLNSNGFDSGGGIFGAVAPPFAEGKYSVEVVDLGWSIKSGFTDETKCIAEFLVEKTPGSKCAIHFLDSDLKKETDIKIKVDGFADLSTSYITYVQENDERGKIVKTVCHTPDEYGADDGISLEKDYSGTYLISIYPINTLNQVACIGIVSWLAGGLTPTARFGAPRACTGIMFVPGFGIGTGTAEAASMSGFLTYTGKAIDSPCKNSSSTDPHYICSTAIGDIDTNPTAFIKQLFGILLSLSGGIAILLIISAGYQIMVSQGDPERIQGARDTITSTIIGLVFIIFSLIILQIIGVDILHIPGFSK